VDRDVGVKKKKRKSERELTPTSFNNCQLAYWIVPLYNQEIFLPKSGKVPINSRIGVD